MLLNPRRLNDQKLKILKNFLSTIPLFGLSEISAHIERVKGAGKKNLMVIYKTGENVPADRDYLEKILNAVGVHLENDAFYLEISDKQIPPWAALNRHFHANYCFLFGIPPGSAGIRLNMPLYRPLTYREVTYLCSDSLEKIRLEREAGDNRAAGALWKALLEIFPKV